MFQLNYHHLLYFKVIAEEGNLTRAAQKLQIRQPALSIQLKQFEETIGHKLFDRKNRSLQITSVGKMTLKYANEIFNAGLELQNTLTQKNLETKSKIYIGAINNIPKSLICSLTEYILSHHSCEVIIYENEREELLEKIDNHYLDFILTNYPIVKQNDDKLYSQKIASFNVYAFVSKKHKIKHNNFPKSLSGCATILPSYHNKLRRDLDLFFHKRKISTKMLIQTQDTSIQKIMATKTTGVIFESRFAVRELLSTKQLVEIGRLEGVKEDYFINTTKKIIPHPVVDDILNNFKVQ